MRKVKLQIQLSIDSFVAGPNGEMDWMVWEWDEPLKEYVKELTAPVDCVIMGRKLAQGFIPHWTSALTKPETADEFAKKMVETEKVVFTKTLEKSDPIVSGWQNTKLAKGNLSEEVNALKKLSGKDIITYGGSTFASDLIRYNLIDEYHLFINPTAIGSGMAIFNRLESKLNLSLIKSTSFNCGIVVLHVEPKK